MKAFLGYWYIGAIVALLAAVGAQQLRVSSAKQELAEYKLQTEANIRAAAQEQRAIEQRRQKAVNEEAEHAQKQIAQLEDDLRGASVAADGLRGAVADAARRARARACVTSRAPAEPGSDPIGVLAHVLDRIDAAAGVYAATADARKIRASGCERAYDASVDR